MTIVRGWWVGLCCAASVSLAVAGDGSQERDARWWQAAEAAVTAPHTAATRIVRLDRARLHGILAALPSAAQPRASRPLLSVPLPDGGNLRVRLAASEVMAPELAARYPAIRTFSALGDDPHHRIHGRFSYGAGGLRGQLFVDGRTLYLDPLRDDADAVRIAWRDALPVRERPADDVLAPPHGTLRDPAAPAGAELAAGGLITYRLALAATAEYALFHDPDVASGDKQRVLEELVNVANRVSGILERDSAVALQLVAENDALIYSDPASDPYLNYSLPFNVTYNTAAIDAAIGAGAYDIGHVLGTDGGGLATLGVVCSASKGAGATGLAAPVGDAFYVDYVAHEIAHQFAATHTFNSTQGACAGQRVAASAYEPGSGSSLMSYAGLCGSDDLQATVDDALHPASIAQIVAYTRSGAGSSCGSVAMTANQVPVADAGRDGHTIPMATPFVLTGEASDADGDTLRYRWAQFDLGEPGSASAPLFRMSEPSADPRRIFPRSEDLLAGTSSPGERLPDSARTLNFRLTVQDVRSAPDAPGIVVDDVQLQVTDQAGPFRVTHPQAGETLRAGRFYSVRWDVANSDLPPVSCASVDIHLSTDGGHSFPLLLRDAAPNDGLQIVRVPAGLWTDRARIRVSCRDNLFFAISPADVGISRATLRSAHEQAP